MTPKVQLLANVYFGALKLRNGIKDLDSLSYEYSNEKVTELKAALGRVADMAEKMIKKEEACNGSDTQDEAGD